MDRSQQRTIVLVCYILHLVGAITGLLSVIGLVINLLKMGVGDKATESHHRFMIRTFVIAIFLLIVTVALYLTLILIPLAWILGLVTWLWYVYRHIRGLLRLLDGEAAPS